MGSDIKNKTRFVHELISFSFDGDFMNYFFILIQLDQNDIPVGIWIFPMVKACGTTILYPYSQN